MLRVVPAAEIGRHEDRLGRQQKCRRSNKPSRGRIMDRRQFLQLGILATMALERTPSSSGEADQVLYNGIRMPSPWPPRLKPLTVSRGGSLPVVAAGGHSDRRRPATLRRRLPDREDHSRAHCATRQRTTATPVSARPAMGDDRQESDGDGLQRRRLVRPEGRLFKMWYMGGYVRCTCYATSRDGIGWEKPDLDVQKGTNIVHAGGARLDHRLARLTTRRTRSERFKMFALDSPGQAGWACWRFIVAGRHPLDVARVQRAVPATARRSSTTRSAACGCSASARCGGTRQRRYWEMRDSWPGRSGSRTSRMRGSAPTDSIRRATTSRRMPQLYNLDGVAYESMLLGLFTIWRRRSRRTGRSPTRSCVGFSRDGFHWHRPDRRAFCPVSETAGRLELGQRAVGRRRLPGRRRPALLLRQRPGRHLGSTSSGVSTTSP